MTFEQRELSFIEHANQYETAFMALEANTHVQFQLRDEIGYADKQIADMAADAMTQVIADLDGAKSNADERNARQAQILSVSGPYLDAVRERAEKQQELMCHGAAATRLGEVARLHRKWMEWLIATTGVPPIVTIAEAHHPQRD